MSQPGHVPPSGELPPVDPSAVREFNRLVGPAEYFNNPRHMSVVLGSLPSEDQQLYGKIGLGMFPENSVYVPFTVLGNFDGLGEFARLAAPIVTTGLELTVPRAFAVHSIVAAYARATANELPAIEGVDDREAFFLTHFASRLAWQTPVEAIEGGPDPFAFFKAIGNRTVQLARAVNQRPEWLQSKLHLLTDRLIMRKHMTRIIEAEPEIEVENVQQLEQTNSELFVELRRLERHNIQSSIYTEGDSSWSIHDMLDYSMQLAAAIEARYGTDTDAVRPDHWKPHMVMQAIERQSADEDDLIVNPLLGTMDDRPNYDMYGRLVYLGEDGNLYADQHGAVPLRQLYEAAEKPANYEVLRQLIMQMYFDHTVPGALVETAKAQTNQMLNTEDPGRDRQQGIIHTDLLLLRIHMLRSFANADELERAGGAI